MFRLSTILDLWQYIQIYNNIFSIHDTLIFNCVLDIWLYIYIHNYLFRIYKNIYSDLQQYYILDLWHHIQICKYIFRIYDSILRFIYFGFTKIYFDLLKCIQELWHYIQIYIFKIYYYIQYMFILIVKVPIFYFCSTTIKEVNVIFKLIFYHHVASCSIYHNLA